MNWAENVHFHCSALLPLLLRQRDANRPTTCANEQRGDGAAEVVDGRDEAVVPPIVGHRVVAAHGAWRDGTLVTRRVGDD